MTNEQIQSNILFYVDIAKCSLLRRICTKTYNAYTCLSINFAICLSMNFPNVGTIKTCDK
jgi:hypothetical protein